MPTLKNKLNNNNLTGQNVLQPLQQPGLQQQISAEPEPLLPEKIEQPVVATPEQAKERKQIADITKETKTSETPRDFESLISRINKVQTKLPKEQENEFNLRLQELQDKQKEALKKYEEDKGGTEWASVAETLAHAITQLGAGLYGMKHGIDMSGVKFNKTDWNSKLNQLNKDLDRKLRLGKEETESVAREKREDERAVDKETDFMRNLLVRDYYNQISEASRDKREAEKAAKDFQKKAEKEGMDKSKAAQRFALERNKAQLSKIKQQKDELQKAKTSISLFGSDELDETQMSAALKRMFHNPNFADKLIKEGRDPNFLQKFFGGEGSLDADQLTKLTEAKQKALDKAEQDALNLREQIMTGNTAVPKEQAVQPSPEQNTGMVDVISPDGQVGEIPAENLEAALKAGYKKAN